MSSNLILEKVPRLSNDEISEFEKNILSNITALKKLQYKMSPSEYAVLINYHNYIMNSFTIMKEDNASYEVNSYKANKANKASNMNSVPVTKNTNQKGDWSDAFSSNLLLKPPSFIYPPKNTFKFTK